MFYGEEGERSPRFGHNRYVFRDDRLEISHKEGYGRVTGKTGGGRAIGGEGRMCMQDTKNKIKKLETENGEIKKI